MIIEIDTPPDSGKFVTYYSRDNDVVSVIQERIFVRRIGATRSTLKSRTSYREDTQEILNSLSSGRTWSRTIKVLINVLKGDKLKSSWEQVN